MLTDVKTPHGVFYMPQRLMVPLFQRPYVWSREGQWEPLWEDIVRISTRKLAHVPVAPHFLGAVVLQQQATGVGNLPVRSVIDGQQRLTTLQLLLRATYEQVSLAGFQPIARQVQDLVENPPHYATSPQDKFKVWPTNKDRPAFNAVMGDNDGQQQSSEAPGSSRLAKAHEYFSASIAEWIGGEDQERRCATLVEVITSSLQIVVIELLADEDAQEIFETLNARGTPLTAADLIKNFVFQRLGTTPEGAEEAYHQYWQQFETPFWETEVSSGRINYSRSSLFLNQWLIAQSLKEVTAREVFAQFKRHVTDSVDNIDRLLPQIRESAAFYKKFTEDSMDQTAILNRLNLFIYRTSTLESEVVKPLVLWLHNRALPPIPEASLNHCLDVVESWLVRRNCVRATTKAYNKVFVDLLKKLSVIPRENVGQGTENFFRAATAPSDYWPGDAEVRRELTSLPIYRRFKRARLRMILEAIEDHRRGWPTGKQFHEQPVRRSACTIEHILPQDWEAHWPLNATEARVENRKAAIQTLGNLTLITQSLNSKISNGPWDGPSGKFQALEAHTSLLLTREIQQLGPVEWNEVLIAQRTERMIAEILEIWAVPKGHTGHVAGFLQRLTPTVEVADLVRAGLVVPGQTLFARTQQYRGRECQISEDGALYVGDRRYETLSAAAKSISGNQSEAGWWFWVVDLESKRSMSEIRTDYLAAFDEDVADPDREAIDLETPESLSV